ncbi:capsule biosynthesis protein [Falsiroseomonas tokyonensis]|uniref:Capsule biosynthesis protein n=1 Tax=Falsiroseomonas tokyonensis TaxID=430521 RepID=A0ABV7C097_9PROT
MLLVLLPTALVGLYYATYAADMYEAEARILVRGRPGANASGAGGIASILGASAGSLRTGAEEAQAVTSFIDSLDAVNGLGRQLDLAEIWRRPEADRISRLWYENPEAERLLRYYRRRVTVEYDLETGLITLKVLAYRPEDSKAIAEALLSLSEELVNRFSARTSQDTLRVGREEVQIAERRVIAAREALTAFREREQTLDPTAAAGTAVETIGRLEGVLAQTRAELQEKQAFMRRDNPQIQVLQNRIAALQAQIAVERARRTRGEENLTQQLSGYERLTLEREFAERVYASAIGSLEAARADAQRQQVFLMRVVEPNLAERATFPKAMFNTVTLLVALTVLFAIGWLIMAGAREHAS